MSKAYPDIDWRGDIFCEVTHLSFSECKLKLQDGGSWVHGILWVLLRYAFVWMIRNLSSDQYSSDDLA